MLLAVEALLGEHGVQHLAARLDGGVIDLDGSLNLVQVIFLLPLRDHAAQGGDLVLQVVALAVDDLNIFTGELILGPLLLPELLLE